MIPGHFTEVDIPDICAIADRVWAMAEKLQLERAMVLEAQLHDFLCSGAMPRDLSLVHDYESRRFDVEWRPPAPLRIR